jgi:hypothetical protein
LPEVKDATYFDNNLFEEPFQVTLNTKGRVKEKV